ncbi:PIG-L family deacetylase [Ferruginibacter paludis]|uniref:PIG-L family deacetylase n=1 Tax=Ferruginibacter paludis TaxID=1310417 RepID=UPI0025B2AEE5|nr:PIG-L family deacetylase [Ferruginibacter paludis]MDN3658081.1 PIG-L family deacetylase [Ferruginibacter paludis]
MKCMLFLHSFFFKVITCCGFIICFIVVDSTDVSAQTNTDGLYKVLTLIGEKQAARDLPQDHGVTGLYQKLLKLTTTASALHTQAHPDDEAADLVTYLGRGTGARTALLSLNRGESGGNVVGVEAFDALGLLRTEEFLLAASYYGLDDLYFTKLLDYGFSKRVEEAYDKWGKENVLREMVKVIRINRPLVIVSRFYGSARDGHGNHEAAGEISQQAFLLAGDPLAFPEQITSEGLRPWKALKFYRGGVEENEHWNIGLNTGEYSPWLGKSYKNFAALGYSFHRSQFGGQINEVNGPTVQYYERLYSNVTSNEKENSFFDGIDTTLTCIFTITGETAPTGVMPLLTDIATDVTQAIAALRINTPAAIVSQLTDGLSKTRTAIRLLPHQSEAAFLLQVKERQFTDAINTALGIHLQAVAVPENTSDTRNFWEPLATMGFAVAGRTFKVQIELVNNSTVSIEPKQIQVNGPAGTGLIGSEAMFNLLQANEKITQTCDVTLPENALYSQPYFYRDSLQQNQYFLKNSAYEYLPWGAPAMNVSASYTINGEAIELQMPVQVRQVNLPYGYNDYTLKIAPAIAVNIQPRQGIVPLSKKAKSIDVTIELVNNYDSVITGTLALQVPAGWKTVPQQTPFTFSRAGERNNFTIKMLMPAIEEKSYSIQATATANGKAYTEGYELISHRDMDQAVLYHAAIASIKGINVTVTPGIRIGYVMGVGDEVPRCLEQLGAAVQLLNTSDLSSGVLSRYDVIMLGTRAYAVRADLNTYNQRLLDYANNGGHLIVLFQTPEFMPRKMAPYPAVLPDNSEEVSEEDSPIQLLAEHHRVLNYPNKISLKDFEQWQEQRGSKFFSTWDTAYTPIIAAYDKGQAPQSGGWLMAKVGKGYYTYCAYAFHRQLPNGVTGAYRIMANLISYGKK